MLMALLLTASQAHFTEVMNKPHTTLEESYAEGRALASYGYPSAMLAASFFPVWEAWKVTSKLFPRAVSVVNPSLEQIFGNDPMTSPVITERSGDCSLSNVFAGQLGVLDEVFQ